MIQPGDIVLTRMAQVDGGRKLRPALVLCTLLGKAGDRLVSGISTQTHQFIADWNDIVQPTDPDFSATGLRRASIVRLSFLAAVSAASVEGGIGQLTPARLEALQRRLARRLAQVPPP